MIVIMQPGATEKQIERVVKRIKDSGLDYQLNTGSEQVVY